MFRNVARIDLSRAEIAVPAFLTVVLMPLSYSISTGLAFGFVSYLVVAVALSAQTRRRAMVPAS